MMPRCCVDRVGGTVYARCDVPNGQNDKGAAKAGVMAALEKMNAPAGGVTLERSVATIGEALPNITRLTPNSSAARRGPQLRSMIGSSTWEGRARS